MWKFLSNNWTQIAVTAMGAFLGFLFALFVEWIKIWRDKKKAQKIVAEENNRKIEYFILLLEEVVRLSGRQIDMIKKYIIEQQRDSLKLMPLKFIATNVFTRIKNIDNRGVFEALTARFRNDKTWLSYYNELNSSLDFLDWLFLKELHRINNNTLERGYKDLYYIKDLINSIDNTLSKEAMNIMHKLGNARFEDSEYLFIDKKINLYRQLIEGQSDLNQINTSFLRPMQEEIIKEQPEFEKYPYIQEILFKSKDARTKMYNVSQDINNVLNTYTKYVQQIQQQVADIKQMIITIK